MNRKVHFFFAMLLVTGMVCAQDEYRAQYSYDSAGNQTNRNWVCVNCQNSSQALPVDTVAVVETEVKDEVLEDLLGSTLPEERNTIDAYPNPVTDLLQVSWIQNEKEVREIVLFSMDGRQLYQKEVQQKQGNLNMDFSNFPPGRYIIAVEFNDRSRKAFHILKK